MKTGTTVVLDKVSEVMKGIALLAGTRVMVGVPASKAAREDGQPINNAALAYIHDNGAPEANIPARPFLKEGVESAQAEINDGFRKVGEAALDGNPGAAERGFHAVGLKAQAAVRAKITAGPFQPLKPATLAARRRRGRTGTKPLLDTAQLRNAINYVVRKV